MQATTKDAYKLFHNGVLTLARAERNGIRCDVEYCEKMINHLNRKIERLQDKITLTKLVRQWKAIYGNKFTFNSDQQLAHILFDRMRLTPIKTTVNGAPSTDEESLDALIQYVPELKDLLYMRKLTKACDYLKGFVYEQVNGIIHTNFNLHFARSFRPSTDNPNLANVPKRNKEIQKIVRKAIKARPGHKIVSADFKGVEVGIACCYNLDPVLISYVKDTTKDMHRDMAMRLYLLNQDQITKEIRHSGKNEFVFPEFYGDWYMSCANSLWDSAQTHVLLDGTSLLSHLKQRGIVTLEQFIKHVKEVEDWFWKKNFKVYNKWKQIWWEAYLRKGYFDMLTGFRCTAIMDQKQACNYPVQGTAFHCLLQCLIWLDEDSIKEKWDSFICNQIYDDAMLDVHPKEEKMVLDRIKMYMTERLPEHFEWINVPMNVEIETTLIDGTWFDKSEKYIGK